MALPKIETPTYELTLPSQDLKVKYRPFLVKEEKVLMMTQEAGSQKDMTTSVLEVLNACTFNAVDLKKLPIFDVEYLFLNVRARSVGEIAKFRVICQDDMETKTNVDIDLTKVEVQVNEEHTNDILLDEDRKLGVIFQYPSLGELGAVDVERKELTSNEIFDMIIKCIDHIYEGEKIYPAKDSSREEMQTFLESLQTDQFTRMQKFFETMPVLKHEVMVENPKTKVKSKMTFTGLSDFFSSASPTTH